ncbi:hypothetical protein ES705_30345 [subsurface metagenome]
MVDPYEDLSFRNMVWFFQDELRAIRDGSSGKAFFSNVMILKLRRKNILGLKIKRHSKGGMRVHVVTPEARALLDSS